MANALHHISVFVSNMDRAIHLFRDILGFELIWRISKVGGQQLSALVGIPIMKTELAYLRSSTDEVAVELARLIQPTFEGNAVCFGMPGTAGLRLVADDLDRLHQRLTQEGWNPLTPCLPMLSPEGENIRVFCIRVEDRLTLEFIGLSVASGLNDERG